MKQIISYLLSFYQKRGFFLRILLCWGIGYFSLTQDEISSFDLRFFIRGEQTPSNQIKIINLAPSDFRSFKWPDQYNQNTDMDYWDKKIWTRLISELIAMRPQKIIVNFNFTNNVIGQLDSKTISLFKNPKIIWATSSANLEKREPPAYILSNYANAAQYNFRKDEDGVIRKVYFEPGAFPNIFESINMTNYSKLVEKSKDNFEIINFRGSKESFEKFSLKELQNPDFSPLEIQNKIVIIGAAQSSQELLTSVGWLTPSELLAHAIDNFISSRWVTRAPAIIYSIGLFLLVIFSVLIITRYPQAVAIFVLIWIATLILAISAWAFDILNFLIPARSAIVQLLTTWIVFVGYMATNIEKKHWALKQEQLNHAQLEQLKNNFVSLISHDLKTPIAKIQAIIDRLIVQNEDSKLQDDFKNLRQSSEELNKYIKSILQVLRVESKDFKINKEIVDINQLIEEAASHLQSLAKEKNINIKLDLDPLFSVEIDPHLVTEVIQNLIENAIKYTHEGQILVTSKEIQDNIYVNVIDTGEGIEPEELENIWGKFVRGKNQDLKTKGTGLGLYLVKYFIELHGGQVFIQSEKGIGTQAGFKLPVENIEGESHETT